MRRAAAFGALIASAALVSACNGTGGSSAVYGPGGGATSTASPSPTPFSSSCPTPTAGSVIYANPNPLTVNVGQNATLSVCEAGYAGSFTVTGSNQSCVVTPLGTNRTWNVYGAFAGTCTITIYDSYRNTLQVPVTVG
jgi:hypothetical protein